MKFFPSMFSHRRATPSEAPKPEPEPAPLSPVALARQEHEAANVAREEEIRREGQREIEDACTGPLRCWWPGDVSMPRRRRNLGARGADVLDALRGRPR